MVAGTLTTIVLGSISALADIDDATRSHLALASACTMLAVQIAMWPPLRPAAEQAVERPPGVAKTGRLLIVLVTLVRSFCLGLLSFYVVENLDEPGFHHQVALLAAWCQVLHLVRRWASHLAGFPVDWAFLRGADGVRHVLGIGVTSAMSASAASLVQVAETVFDSGPGLVFGLLTDRGLWNWFAVLVTVFLCVLAAFLVIVLEGTLQHLAAKAIGEDNSVGAWLEEHSPVRVEGPPGFRTLHFKFVIEYDGPLPELSREPPHRDLVRMRQYERRLEHRDEAELRRRIVDAMVAQAPPGWESLRLDHRGVVGYDEIVLTVNHPDRQAADEPAGPGPGSGTRTWQLPTFSERDALRTLREARYKAGYGAPFTQHFTARSEGGRQITGSGYTQGPEEEEPAWTTAPTRAQYRADLQRFPVSRRTRPRWLRRRLRRFRR